MVHDRLDVVKVEFDDERAVGNAGVLLVATLARRLGLQQLVGDCVRLGKPGARFRPGRKVMSLVFAMLLGAQSINGCDLLRSGRTGRLLGVRVMAPSTLGTFLRAFSFGHVRQLDRVLGLTLGKAWRAGAGPGADRLVIDVDSFVGQVYGRLKHGASRGYTHVLGYHPLLATRADTGEVLHIRFRTGKANTQRGVIRFVDELSRGSAPPARPARSCCEPTRAFIASRCASGSPRRASCTRSAPGVTKRVEAAISEIADDARQTLTDYPATGVAQIAETVLDGERLIVRRVRPLGSDAQGQLFETWQHHALISNRSDALNLVEAEHRAHAVVELAIRDVKVVGAASGHAGIVKASCVEGAGGARF